MNNPQVRAAIEDRTAKTLEPARMYEAWVWSKLEFIIDTNIERRPQIVLKAIELAGRKHKMWVDRVEVDSFSGHAERINRFIAEMEKGEQSPPEQPETIEEEEPSSTPPDRIN